MSAIPVEDTIVTCPKCKGNGMVDGERCANCDGQGFTRKPGPGEEHAAAAPASTSAAKRPSVRSRITRRVRK